MKDLFKRIMGASGLLIYFVIAVLIVLLSQHRFQIVDADRYTWEPGWETAIPTADDVHLPTSLKTADNWKDLMRYVAVHRPETLTMTVKSSEVVYSDVNSLLSEAYEWGTITMPDLLGYLSGDIPGTFAKNNGSVTLTFQFPYTGNIESEHDVVMRTAQEAVQSLYDSGTLTREMSEWDRAHVLLQWVADHMTYDASVVYPNSPYTVFALGRGTCGGYTAMLNLLLKLDGIDCWGESGYAFGDYHGWTVAICDGKPAYLDATLFDCYQEQERDFDSIKDRVYTREEHDFYNWHLPIIQGG